MIFVVRERFELKNWNVYVKFQLISFIRIWSSHLTIRSDFLHFLLEKSELTSPLFLKNK